ncbi:MAG: RagB/SusD family nutrient uptake outer membrane protein [Dysgonomonas sp.]|nr:RagB/SusD family nutrient uptake outer membrane protein [Dysgonomonas sp.]
MKKIIYIIASIAVILFSSCSDQLDIKSQMSLDADSELSVEDVDKLVNGVMQTVLSPHSYAYFVVLYPEILSDNLEPVNFQWGQVRDAYYHEVLADDILNSYLYPFMYTAIKRANVILGVPSASNSQKAIARYCRAYSYMRLLDLYGEVPLIDETYDNEFVRKAKVERIWAFVIQDLEFAKTNAPEFNTSDPTANSYPTREAAMALLARAYRLSGDIAKAGIEAENVIKTNKFPLATSMKSSESEIIMNFLQQPNTDKSYGEWGYIMSWEARGWNCLALSPEIVDLIKGTTDTRVAWYDFDEAANRDGYVFPNMYKMNSDSELFVSRIGEMYLVSAEAGNTNRLTEFQAIRKSNLSLANERRVELACQFVRWGDMKLAGETYIMPIPKASQDANPHLSEPAE